MLPGQYVTSSVQEHGICAKVQNLVSSLHTGVDVDVVQCFAIAILECLYISGCSGVFYPGLLCRCYKVLYALRFFLSWSVMLLTIYSITKMQLLTLLY